MTECARRVGQIGGAPAAFLKGSDSQPQRPLNVGGVPIQQAPRRPAVPGLIVLRGLTERHADRLSGQLDDEPSHVRVGRDKRVPGRGDGVAGHAVVVRVGRILHDDAAAAALHGGAAERGIAHRAAEHHRRRPRSRVQCRAAKQRIRGRAEPVLTRAVRQPDHVLDDEHVPVCRRHIDPARLDPLTVDGALGRQRTGQVQDAGQATATGRGHVQHDENRGRQIRGEPAQHDAQRP
jgi:hypothetical protein